MASQALLNAQKQLEQRRRQLYQVARVEWRPGWRTYHQDGFTGLQKVEELWEYRNYSGLSGWHKTNQYREVESSTEQRAKLLNATLSDDHRPGFVVRQTVQTEEEKQRIREAWQAHDEKYAAIGAAELLIRLSKAVEVNRLKAKRGPLPPPTVKAYPTLLNASHKAGLVPAARVYLMIKASDQAGRGCVNVADLRQLLTGKRSRWRVKRLSWARLRQVLNQGEGVFWDRHTGDRLWLRGPDKIAEALQCGRLMGLPIELPVKALKDTIKAVKAHFSASYESGRQSDKPLSQAALADITGVPERTQREYNKLLKRKTRKNITVTGLSYTTENVQLITGKEQRPVFRFVDWLGKQGGPKQADYVAYRIADTRSQCHKQAARGRQRKINHAINLVNTPARGKHGEVARAYHPTAEDAAAAYNRDPELDRYYPTGGGALPNAKKKARLEYVGIWGVLLA